MKGNKYIFTLLLMIYFMNSSKCIKIDQNAYEILEYKHKYDHVFNLTEGNEKIFYLKMEVDKILTNDCLINIYQTDPQIPTLYYTFDENKDFVKLYNWQTINRMEQHTMYYKIEKEENKKWLYLAIKVTGFKDKQNFVVESVDSQFNFFIIVYIVIAVSTIIVFVIVFAVSFRMFKPQALENDPNNIETIFAKVGPEDY